MIVEDVEGLGVSAKHQGAAVDRQRLFRDLGEGVRHAHCVPPDPGAVPVTHVTPLDKYPSTRIITIYQSKSDITWLQANTVGLAGVELVLRPQICIYSTFSNSLELIFTSGLVFLSITPITRILLRDDNDEDLNCLCMC